MRLALISDIHGNSIALDAVLADIEAFGGVDEYWVLGDLVALGPDPVGVLERLHELGAARFVRGNTDRYTTDAGRPWASVDEAFGTVENLLQLEGSMAFAQGAAVASGHLEWLASLPVEQRTELPDGTRLLAVHASPGRDDGDGVTPERPEDELVAMFDDCEADLVVVGHTHVVVDREVAGVRVVNPGSVSNPPAPDLRARYAIVDAADERYELDLRAVDYDREAVIDQLEAVRHPRRQVLSGYFRDGLEPTR